MRPPNSVVPQKSVVVRQKKRWVWDKKFIKKVWIVWKENGADPTTNPPSPTNSSHTITNLNKTIREQKSDSFHTVPIDHPFIHQRIQKTLQKNARTAQKNGGLRYTITIDCWYLLYFIRRIRLQQKPFIIHTIPGTSIQFPHSRLM